MSAAERQAGNAGGGDDTERHGLAEQMSGVIDFTRRAAGTDPDRPVFRIDPDSFHGRQINDQTVFHAAEARAVMATAADGNAQALVAAKIHRRNDIGDIGAAHDEPRPLVDHGVIEFAGSIIVRVVGANDWSAHRRRKCSNVLIAHCTAPPRRLMTGSC